MPSTFFKDNLPSVVTRFWNKEALVFVFLLFMSAAFWVSMALSESYERDIRIPVVLKNVPENVILLDNETDTVTVSIRANGSAFLYKTFEDKDTIALDFAQYKQEDRVVVSNNELQKLLRQKFDDYIQVLSIKHDGILFRFNYGEHKRVPVRFEGRVGSRADKEITLYPDSVTIYAQPDLLKNLKEVRTVRDSIDCNEDSVKYINLARINGAKCKPNRVKVGVKELIFVENTIEVPVECINEPANKKLVLFPSRVSVTYVVDIRKHNLIEKDLFRVEANYNEVADMSAQTCKLKLVAKPSFVKTAKLSVEESKYLIKDR